jgi:hypothetical protein
MIVVTDKKEREDLLYFLKCGENDEYLLKYDEYKDFYFDGSSTNHKTDQEYQSYLNYIRTPIIREIRLNHLLK